MVKPIGPACNLDCRYCFYLEKAKLFPAGGSLRMADDVLESFIRQYVAAQPDAPELHFAWQGGEPTLLGLDFFRRVVELQRRYAAGRPVLNALQTNATLLDDAWCAFLAEHHFLCGVSLDGPRVLNDAYRVAPNGASVFDEVINAVERLKKHGAAFNTLTVINRLNAQQPLEVYRFLKELGSGFLQFIPLVERRPDAGAQALGLTLALPPGPAAADGRAAVTDWSVRPEDYGIFLTTIFDEWVRQDVGRIHVQLFDATLAAWMGLDSAVCVFAPECGNALILEHNGDVYACDHYVYPAYRRGNLREKSLTELAWSEEQLQFGRDKAARLPAACRHCNFLFACQGECPKHRFLKTPAGEPGLNYLCAGLKHFFTHVTLDMDVMAQLLNAGRPTEHIMEMIAHEEGRSGGPPASRNAPCPCGSGRKFKHCCGAK